MGVQSSSNRVIIMLPRCPHWQIAMTACLKLGAVVVPCITMLIRRFATPCLPEKA